MFRISVLSLLPALVLFPAANSARAQATKTSASPTAAVPAKPAAGAPADAVNLPPLPADAHIEQTMQYDGRTLRYTVTVGKMPVRDKMGKTIGEVVYTAYTVPGKDRPVTFAFNGGPGASSVYLNLGAIGPKHLDFGNAGESPSKTPTLTDNPGTWLDFTDLVFIDPIGSGVSLCSRSRCAAVMEGSVTIHGIGDRSPCDSIVGFR